MQFHPEKDQERPPSPAVARRRLEACSSRGSVVRQQTGYIGILNFTYSLLWCVVVRRRRNHLQGWHPPTSMILSYLGFPCYLVAVRLAFWSPIAGLVICGMLWALWTIMPPVLSAEQ